MQLKNVMKYIVSILFVLILFIPVYEVFTPYENKPEKECWEFAFIWNDSIAFLSYIILFIGWFLNLIKQNKFLKISLITFSILNLIGTILATSMPSQDLFFLPGTGIYMMVCFLVPLYLIKFEKR